MNEITKNNILLAIFIGYIDNACSEEGFLICPHTNYDIEVSSMNFNSDWNWLMLLVDKIESLTYRVRFEMETCFILDSDFETVTETTGNERSKIEAVYNTCVGFVKWYNQNKAI